MVLSCSSPVMYRMLCGGGRVDLQIAKAGPAFTRSHEVTSRALSERNTVTTDQNFMVSSICTTLRASRAGG